jgi:flagellar basal-body rod modification protein FlgD
METPTVVAAAVNATSVPTPVDPAPASTNLTQDPPLLSINGQNYSLEKIKRIVRSGA